MRRLSKEEKAGIYSTVILHLTVLIILMATSLGFSLSKENSFVLDFTKYEELERMQAEIERLQKEAELQEAISRKLEAEIGSTPVRNVAVDRSALKDDRGTDAEKLYKDAERLAKELKGGYEAPSEDVAEPLTKDSGNKKEEKKENYSGPSVVSYSLEGRKASKLSIPAYRCMGSGEVTVLITVDNQGSVIMAKVDESCSSKDGCLRNFAVRAARLSKFSASTTAPARQQGNIVYKFIAQ